MRWRAFAGAVCAALFYGLVPVAGGAPPGMLGPPVAAAGAERRPATIEPLPIPSDGESQLYLLPARPHVRAPSAILVDLTTGRILFAKHPDQRRPVASLTKIMTALLVLERSDLAQVVTVSRKAAATDPIVLGLQPGERITVKSLLWGLLLWSGNDAAVALAEHVSGSVAGFLRLMNALAREMGLRDTFFASSNGLDDDGYSTARDLEILARVALRDRFFAAVVRSRFHRIPGPPGQVHRLWNLNEMLIRYPGSIGVKTGYTRGAGNCLVAAAARDGKALVAVVLGDPPGTHWRFAYGDASALLDFGFAMETFPVFARAVRAA